MLQPRQILPQEVQVLLHHLSNGGRKGTSLNHRMRRQLVLLLLRPQNQRARTSPLNKVLSLKYLAPWDISFVKLSALQ